MSWTPAQPPQMGLSASARRRSPVTIALTVPKGRRPVIRLVMRANLIGVNWLKVGDSVGIDIGTGDHSGILRVSKGGPIRVAKPGGRKDTKHADTVLAVLAPFPTLDLVTRPAKSCRVEVAGDALIISLPSWAVVAETIPGRAAPMPSVAAPPAPAAKRPFGITAPSQADINAWKTEGVR